MARRSERNAIGLAGRVNLAVLSILVLGLGLAAYFFAASLTSARESLVDRSLRREADILYLSIESFMMPGEAPVAAQFFSNVAGLGQGFVLGLYRRDGVVAFSDNATIRTVNANLGRQRFAPRSAAPSPEALGLPEMALFDKAVAIPPESVFFTWEEGGRSYKRVYRPLLNLPKCAACHGSDHTIRGVLDISADVSGVLRDEAVTVAASVLGFAAMALALAAIIGRALRSVVVEPVRAIGRLCEAVTGGDFSGRVDDRRGDEIGSLASTVNAMVNGLRERYELTKYVSTGTIGALASGQEPRRVERTLLFTDVRGFTAYTERHGAEAILAVLNRLLERQAEIVAAHGGDVDKFVGDAVVAIFSGDDAPARACDAALAIRGEVRRASGRYDSLSVGAGIATGNVVQGMVGSSVRADFTVLGDAVNVTSRLCSIAKPGQVLVCDCTRDRLVGGPHSFDGPYKARLKGKAQPQVLSVLSGNAVGKEPKDGNDAV